MNTIFFTDDLRINHCIKHGSTYYSTEEFDTELINDTFFNNIKIYNEDTNELVDERQSVMCETMLLDDDEIDRGYKIQFQFYYPTEEQQANMRFNDIIKSLSSDDTDITNIQLALVELYQMINGR